MKVVRRPSSRLGAAYIGFNYLMISVFSLALVPLAKQRSLLSQAGSKEIAQAVPGQTVVILLELHHVT